MAMHLALMPKNLTDDEVLIWHATGAYQDLVHTGSWDPNPSDLPGADDDCWMTLAVMAGHPGAYTDEERKVIADALIADYEEPITCYCGAIVEPLHAVQGTCGSNACLSTAAMDRPGRAS